MNEINKKPLSKEELIARLKAIASDETPRVYDRGAMCYCPAPPPLKLFICDACGHIALLREWNYTKEIKKVIKEMTELGYDAKVEAVCKSCAERIKNELYPNSKSNGEEGFDYEEGFWIGEINHIFYFRLSEDTEYHRALENSIEHYDALLALMENRRIHSDGFGGNLYIADEIDTLEYMTGIKFNI